VAKAKGSRLENLLDMTHQLYRNRGVADINKKEIKTAIDKRTGQMRYIKREGFDYEGCLLGGESISIEAKEAKGHLYIDKNNRSGLKLHQLQALLFRGRLGGLACVIWMRSPDEVYCLDYDFLEYFYENVYGKPGKTSRPVMSITAELAREKAPQVSTGGLIDYLPHMGVL